MFRFNKNILKLENIRVQPGAVWAHDAPPGGAGGGAGGGGAGGRIQPRHHRSGNVILNI